MSASQDSLYLSSFSFSNWLTRSPICCLIDLGWPGSVTGVPDLNWSILSRSLRALSTCPCSTCDGFSSIADSLWRAMPERPSRTHFSPFTNSRRDRARATLWGAKGTGSELATAATAARFKRYRSLARIVRTLLSTNSRKLVPRCA